MAYSSAGITEVSENIWGKNLPYIKSVDSKVDEKAPNFIYKTSIPNSQIIETLSKKYPDLDKNNIISSFDITKRSQADYVLEVTVCGKKINGRDIRTMFGLRSTNFTIEKTKDSINFTTKGYGHGAGMSQYGANFMAQDGSSYEEILMHYYDGISLQKMY
ncbi:MAG: SpoIID/LytB domain-containing protein [Lachnospirales bacterium]|nr:SpoIID/LytB domain-containing protein [Clostridiales bacterium]